MESRTKASPPQAGTTIWICPECGGVEQHKRSCVHRARPSIADRVVLILAVAAILSMIVSSRAALSNAAAEDASEKGGRPAFVRTDPDQDAKVTWSPERPIQGTLFVVRVSGGQAPVAGVFAGERLHFQPADSGGWWSLAAVPIDSAGTLKLSVSFSEPQGTSPAVRGSAEAVATGGAIPSVNVSVPIARGAYTLEKLTVAPQYTALSAALERRTQNESARALAAARGAHATAALWTDSPVQRPRTTRITSGFGNGREFNGKVDSRHMGTDFEGAVGQPVLAAAKGVVRIVDQFYLGGNVIYLDHGGGLTSAYLHLSQQLVKQGDTVQAGQRIGLVGATGRVTGPHLHWIVRYGSVTVDPLSWVGIGVP
jgi:murein DD-endopeptidase MepM/ murein hydrolase activator NlpD